MLVTEATTINARRLDRNLMMNNARLGKVCERRVNGA